MSQAQGTTRRYTNRHEATSAIQQFAKAMATIRGRYTKPGQADYIINRMFEDKFGSDIDLSVISAEFSAGKYDVIVGRIRQAERVRAEQKKTADALKRTLIDEINALYFATTQ